MFVIGEYPISVQTGPYPDEAACIAAGERIKADLAPIYDADLGPKHPRAGKRAGATCTLVEVPVIEAPEKPAKRAPAAKAKAAPVGVAPWPFSGKLPEHASLRK